MFYHELQPARPLRSFVKTYAVIHKKQLTGSRPFWHLHPHLNNTLGIPCGFDDDNSEKKNSPGEGVPADIIWPGKVPENSWAESIEKEYFFIIFHPDQYACLFPFSILDFCKNTVPLYNIREKPLLEYYDRMMLTNTTEERVITSNECLLKRLENMEQNKPITNMAVRLIHSDLQLNIHDISEQLQLTDRHFRRLFFSDMNISAKQYQKLMRLCAAINMLDKWGSGHMAAIAFECGFFDQSHFINTFKLFFGNTPSKYLAALNDDASDQPPIKKTLFS